MLQSALQLAKRGMWVFPCRPHDKRPATTRGLKDATTNPEVIERWWRTQPSCNIGLATGAVSGVMVVDFDDVDAEAEVRKLESENCELPSTVESLTARGRHLFFRWPEREVRNSAGKLAPGVDIRGNGGYVVVPPSLHPSGKRYCWSVDSANSFAAAPEWLLDLITATGSRDTATAAPKWRDMVRDGIGEGCRNDGIARLVGHLLYRRVDPEMTLELALAFNDARCRPPLRSTEVVAVVDSVAALELKRRMNP
jgi:hypothetical protein